MDIVPDVIDREDVVVVVLVVPQVVEVRVRVLSLHNLRVGAVVEAQSERMAVGWDSEVVTQGDRLFRTHDEVFFVASPLLLRLLQTAMARIRQSWIPPANRWLVREKSVAAASVALLCTYAVEVQFVEDEDEWR